MAAGAGRRLDARRRTATGWRTQCAVELVANDTGGAIAQVFAALHPNRVATLTLTNCDTQDNLPPRASLPTVLLDRLRLLAPLARRMLRDPVRARQRVYGPGERRAHRYVGAGNVKQSAPRRGARWTHAAATSRSAARLADDATSCGIARDFRKGSTPSDTRRSCLSSRADVVISRSRFSVRPRARPGVPRAGRRHDPAGNARQPGPSRAPIAFATGPESGCGASRRQRS